MWHVQCYFTRPVTRLRALPLLFVFACTEAPAPVARDAGVPAVSEDAGFDAGVVVDPPDAGSRDAGAAGEDAAVRDAGHPDAGFEPVDCSAVDDVAAWTLCAQDVATCEVLFEDGAGCPAVCAALGLACGGAFENVEGMCAADYERPALSCTEASGHGSDYCVCRSAECNPACDGRSCGPDGCGGLCGTCASTETCVDGTCEDAVQEDCTQYPFSSATLLNELVGFGRRATGGDPSRVYHVTTLSNSGAGSLRNALESNEPYWIVFDVEGRITHPTRVDVRSNKTIDGRGREITIEGTLRLEDTRNVIISDVALTNTLEGRCGQDGDVILVTGDGTTDPATFTSRDLWFHHLELYDGGDGLLDLRGASRVTISWNHLHTHKKAMLMWQNQDGQAVPGMRVTMHHNFFDRTTIRGPQFIYGWAHFFNNYHFEWYEYGAGSLGGAQMASEHNVYEARPGNVCIPAACPDPNPCGDNDRLVSKRALVTDWAENGAGDARSTNDLLLNDAEVETRNPTQVFDPAAIYPYVLDVADTTLAQRIRDEAGPRVDYCQGP